MASLTAPALGAEFLEFTRDVRHALTRVTNAQKQGAIEPADLEILVESRFMAVTARYELFLRDLFFSCLNGVSSLSEVDTRLKQFSDYSNDEVVLDGRKYIEWTPKATEERAKRLLRNGLPFTRLELWNAYGDATNKMLAVRNFLAHGSEESETKYKTVIIGKGIDISPGRWLTTVKQKSPRQTNLEYIIGTLERAATAMTQDRLDLPAHLGILREAEVGEKVSAGRYACTNGDYEWEHLTRGPLPDCPQGCGGKWRLLGYA